MYYLFYPNGIFFFSNDTFEIYKQILVIVLFVENYFLVNFNSKVTTK